MIHPQFWSLYSLYCRLRYGNWGESYGVRPIFTPEDMVAYSKLDVRGKTVLDVGASMGDSARFFLDRGAEKIIAVEMDPKFKEALYKVPRTQVCFEPFKLEHLDLPYDVAKVDVEGAEAIMLGYDKPFKPMIIEAHSQYLIDRFLERGFRIIIPPTTSLANVRIATLRNF